MCEGCDISLYLECICGVEVRGTLITVLSDIFYDTFFMNIVRYIALLRYATYRCLCSKIVVIYDIDDDILVESND